MNHTYDTLRDLGNHLLATGKKEALIALLDEFSSRSIALLPMTQYEEFGEKLQALAPEFQFTIYKYPFAILDRQTVELPSQAVILHVGLDPELNPCLWARVNKADTAKVHKTLFVIGTGHPVPHAARNFITTFNQGPFVWHIFTS